MPLRQNKAIVESCFWPCKQAINNPASGHRVTVTQQLRLIVELNQLSGDCRRSNWFSSDVLLTLIRANMNKKSLRCSENQRLRNSVCGRRLCVMTQSSMTATEWTWQWELVVSFILSLKKEHYLLCIQVFWFSVITTTATNCSSISLCTCNMHFLPPGGTSYILNSHPLME